MNKTYFAEILTPVGRHFLGAGQDFLVGQVEDFEDFIPWRFFTKAYKISVIYTAE